MAYLQFSELGGASIAAPAVRGPAIVDSLSPLEWSVVMLARLDGRGSLRPAGRWTSLLRAVFKRHNPKLADPRLEALRRMAVLAWQSGYTVPSHEVRSFLDAGFTAGQYELLVDRISIARILPRRTVRA
jgi:hypothetical protein